MDEYTGEIRTLKKLDREEKSFYVLQAQAINRRTNEPEEPESEFIIKVQDINDNMPRFQNEPYVSSIPEMSPVGKFDSNKSKMLTIHGLHVAQNARIIQSICDQSNKKKQ